MCRDNILRGNYEKRAPALYHERFSRCGMPWVAKRLRSYLQSPLPTVYHKLVLHEPSNADLMDFLCDVSDVDIIDVPTFEDRVCTIATTRSAFAALLLDSLGEIICKPASRYCPRGARRRFSSEGQRRRHRHRWDIQPKQRSPSFIIFHLHSLSFTITNHY